MAIRAPGAGERKSAPVPLAFPQTGFVPETEIPVPEERDYFRLCGVKYVEPWER